MTNFLSYLAIITGVLSFILVVLQIINELIGLFTPIKSGLFTKQFFSWKEVDIFIDKLTKEIRNKNIEYGMICGTGRGGGILASLLSYKLGLTPVLVLDRKYVIKTDNPTRTSAMVHNKVELSADFKDLYNKPVLLITPHSNPGITLKFYKQVLEASGFIGPIHKCAIVASERTMDTDLDYCLGRYTPETVCRKFPWEKENPDLMKNPIHK